MVLKVETIITHKLYTWKAVENNESQNGRRAEEEPFHLLIICVSFGSCRLVRQRSWFLVNQARAYNNFSERRRLGQAAHSAGSYYPLHTCLMWRNIRMVLRPESWVMDCKMGRKFGPYLILGLVIFVIVDRPERNTR